MVCLPIWHWYMLRGDWLKSENGVTLATSDSMLLVSTSSCVKRSPGVPPAPPSGHLQPPGALTGKLAASAQLCVQDRWR